MERSTPRVLAPLLLTVVLVACGGDPDSAGPQAATSAPPATADPVPARPVPAPESPPPATPDPASASSAGAATAFAPAPAPGTVVRANCRMGGCWWYRLESVRREDGAEPRYRLDLRGGESGPHPDPYPFAADGVEIRWDADGLPGAEVACSRQAPRVKVAGDAIRLPLGPLGVSGVEQGVASLYFAICHGEYGDDAELARKYGYDLR